MDAESIRKSVFDFHEISLYHDGSFLRRPLNPPPYPADPQATPVASKDLPLNHSLATWTRLFLPTTCTSSSSKLPLLLYFHGGAFCIGSASSPHYHHFLSKLAALANALIVSVEYRLAPEYHLPSSYDDCFDALLWLHQQAHIQARGPSPDATHVAHPEPWLFQHADFSKCFLAGDSAGANIAHHVALRATQQSWEHLVLKGMILIHPFFSSEVPTEFESRSPAAWKFIDQLWTMSLPIGVNKDHPFSNPLAADAPSLADAAIPPVMVAVASEDLLKDRGVAYYEALKKAGKEAELFMSENEGHVFFLQTEDADKVRPLFQGMANFLNSGN